MTKRTAVDADLDFRPVAQDCEVAVEDDLDRRHRFKPAVVMVPSTRLPACRGTLGYLVGWQKRCAVSGDGPSVKASPAD